MKVNIDTSIEVFPAVAIVGPEHDPSGCVPPEEFQWEVPDHLYEAYRCMVEGLSALESAILTPLGFTQDRYGEWHAPADG